MRDGDLVWGVKASFVRYVEATGGSVEVRPPASRDDDGRIRFPPAQRSATLLRFCGEATFRTHHGALSLILRDPWFEIRGTPDQAGWITVADVTRPVADGTRILLAEISPTGTTTLAEPGVALFDFHYPAGTELEPVIFDVPPAGPAE